MINIDIAMPRRVGFVHCVGENNPLALLRQRNIDVCGYFCFDDYPSFDFDTNVVVRF